MLQVVYQDAEHGAVPLIKALADGSLTGKGYGYYGPFYKGLFLAHILNDSTCGFVTTYATCIRIDVKKEAQLIKAFARTLSQRTLIQRCAALL